MPAKVYVFNGIDAWIEMGAGGSIPTTPTNPAEQMTAGALSIGSSQYEIPANNVRFVSPTGSNSSSGDQSAPYATVQHAIDQVPSGGTVVIRAGSYHESLSTPNGKHVILQAYPSEEVWFDGSSTYASWSKVSGQSVWTHSYSVNFARFNVDSYPGNDPLRNHPDQVWVDGMALKQVADGTTPGAGEFSVDQGSDILSIGVDPTGKTVRVTDMTHFLMASGRCDLYGIGVRRYSQEAVDGFNHVSAYYGGTSQGTIIENCVFQSASSSPLNLTKPDCRVSLCTFQDSGNSGLLATTADRLLVEKCLFRRLNRGNWHQAPTTGAIKVTRSDEVTVRWCWVEDVPDANGIWFDVSNSRTRIYGNYVDGRAAPGGLQMNCTIFMEISDGGFIDGVQYRNYVVGNISQGGKQARNIGSGYTDWWNNYVYDATVCNLYFQQDRPGNDGQQANNRADVCPWRNVHNRIINNRIGPSDPTGSSQIQILAQDSSTMDIAGWDTFDLIAGNWFQPAPPGSMVQLGEYGKVTRLSYNSLSALASSGATVGGPPGQKLGTNYQGSATPNATQYATQLPANIAGMLGVPAGSRLIGPNINNLPIRMPD